MTNTSTNTYKQQSMAVVALLVALFLGYLLGLLGMLFSLVVGLVLLSKPRTRLVAMGFLGGFALSVLWIIAGASLANSHHWYHSGGH